MFLITMTQSMYMGTEVYQMSFPACRVLPCLEKLVFAEATDMAEVPPTLPLVAAGLRIDFTDWVVEFCTVPLLMLDTLLAASDVIFFF